ncbi:MAG: CHAD domain-containing protein, partial [Pseudomonadota bacterium]
LAPVFETEMRRTTRLLRLPEGGAAELALDQGEIRAGGQAAPLIEAELELIEGTPATLFTIARTLFERTPVRFSRHSKAARGGRLAAGLPAIEPPAVRRARVVSLDPKGGPAAALRALLLECLEQIAANAELIAVSPAPEGPHQLRVGLRRLRAVLRIAKAAGVSIPTLDAAAREFGQAASALRDLDAVRTDLLGPARAARPDDAGLAAIAAALEAAAGPARTTLRARLAAGDFQRFLLDLAEAAATLDVPAVPGLRKTARRALDKAHRKVLAHGPDVAALDVPARHELRKALKRLRSSVSFLGPLFDPVATKAYLKRARSMQRTLGARNDLATAEALFTGGTLPALDCPDTAFAAGRLTGALEVEADRVWAGAGPAWAALAEGDPFWR